MKIDTLQNSGMADTVIRNPAAKQVNEDRQTRHTGSAYNVSLSPQAQQASTAQNNDEAAMYSRLAEIREQLATSTYNISGREVAMKILGLLNG